MSVWESEIGPEIYRVRESGWHLTQVAFRQQRSDALFLHNTAYSEIKVHRDARLDPQAKCVYVALLREASPSTGVHTHHHNFQKI
jgi:hypothetical protein